MLYIRRLVELWAKFSLSKRKLTKKQRLYYQYKLLGTGLKFPAKFRSQYNTLDDLISDSGLIPYYLRKDIITKKESKHGEFRAVFRDRYLGGRTSEEAITLIKEHFNRIHPYFEFGESMTKHPYQVKILSYPLLREYLEILKTLEIQDEELVQFNRTGGGD